VRPEGRREEGGITIGGQGGRYNERSSSKIISDMCVMEVNKNQVDRKIFVGTEGEGVRASVMITGKRIGVLLRVTRNAFHRAELSTGRGSVVWRRAPKNVKRVAEMRFIWYR